MRFRFAVAALALFAAAPAFAQPQTIAPGYWETTSQVLSPLHSTKIERRCIGAAQVAKFMEGRINHIYQCTYPTKVTRDGQIVLKGSCKTRDGAPIPVEGEGTYSRETFHLEARGSASLGPITLPLHAVTDARRLGDDCPAPDAVAATGAGGSQ